MPTHTHSRTHTQSHTHSTFAASFPFLCSFWSLLRIRIEFYALCTTAAVPQRCSGNHLEVFIFMPKENARNYALPSFHRRLFVLTPFFGGHLQVIFSVYAATGACIASVSNVAKGLRNLKRTQHKQTNNTKQNWESHFN